VTVLTVAVCAGVIGEAGHHRAAPAPVARHAVHAVAAVLPGGPGQPPSPSAGKPAARAGRHHPRLRLYALRRVLFPRGYWVRRMFRPGRRRPFWRRRGSGLLPWWPGG
jgi:hypothetical protein